MAHSLRFKFILFILAILLVLLILLNTYPIISSRDAVFQEKRNSLSGQASVVSSALGSLERLSHDGVSDVFRFLDLSSFDRIIVVDEIGNVVYDDGSDPPDLSDLRTALAGHSVFRSVFANAAFHCSRTTRNAPGLFCPSSSALLFFPWQSAASLYCWHFCFPG